MVLIGTILIILLRFYTWLLIARILIEMVQSFSRHFNPPTWFTVIAELIFVATDPPVKAVRKIIPPLPLGGVAIDVSVIVLFLVLSLGTNIVWMMIFSPN